MLPPSDLGNYRPKKVLFVTSYFEWAGALLGLLGAFLLATNTKASRYGWYAFLGANVAKIGFAVNIDAKGLLLQQIGFTCTSLLGLYRSRVPAAKAAG